MTDSTDQIIAARSSQYGEYADNARTMQELKDYWRVQPGWARMRPIHRETLDMLALKIGRILNGDPEVRDNWTDICGYARLSEQRVTELKKETKEKPNVYDTVAEHFNISREQAKEMMLKLTYGFEPKITSPFQAPGTPEDGGHHAPCDEVGVFRKGPAHPDHEAQRPSGAEEPQVKGYAFRSRE